MDKKYLILDIIIKSKELYPYLYVLQSENIFIIASVHVQFISFFFRNWLAEIKETDDNKKTGTKPSLQRAIFKTFYKSYFVYGICLFLQCVVLK